jgi:hypothetical protein
VLLERGRTKKLTVAFHFQYANQATWKCDTCRKQGLQQKRGCGFLPHDPDNPRIIWARKNVSVTNCPVSYITSDSISWLEEHHAWRFGGKPDVMTLHAKSAEAFTILEHELLKEKVDNE